MKNIEITLSPLSILVLVLAVAYGFSVPRSESTAASSSVGRYENMLMAEGRFLILDSETGQYLLWKDGHWGAATNQVPDNLQFGGK